MRALAHVSVVDGGGDRSTRRRERPRLRVALILVMILVFPLLIVAAYFATRNVLPEIGGLTFDLPQGGFQTGSAQSLNSTGLQEASGQLFPSLDVLSTPNLSAINIAEVLVIVTVAVVALIVWRGLSTRHARTTPFEDEGDLLAERRRKMAAILDAAVARLNTGSAYRETVIQCYRLISELLEERSDLDARVLTAREFKKLVSEKLKIETPYLDQLTELFEVARYSEQEITMEQARQAALCLSNLSAPLKEAVAPVGDIR